MIIDDIFKIKDKYKVDFYDAIKIAETIERNDGMLTQEEIEANKKTFLQLVESIERDGMNKEGLIKKLENSDFFYAPASTKFHSNYDGGLCQHSLNVYNNMVKLSKITEGADESCYDENSLKIVGLFHDISKMNIYERCAKNKKEYCDYGKNYDEIGNFIWKSELGWQKKENSFVYGSHEMTSEYITRQFIPLTLDESIAILHHMGGMNFDSAKDNLCKVYNQYSLALLVYLADMMSCYIDEREI